MKKISKKQSEKKARSSATANPSVPQLYFPPIVIPQGDGSFLVKPGKPQILSDEIDTRKFSLLTGLSQRRVNSLCDEGLLEHRRLSPKPKSKIIIPFSEVLRFRKLDGISEREVKS